MDFSFQWQLADGDYVEGVAHIEQCDSDPDEWLIGGISLHAWRPKVIELRPKSDLYKDIALWLYRTKSQEISDAWDARQRETADDHEEAA